MTLADASLDVRLYSAPQLAELWDCSRTHVYELIKKGELPTVDIGIGRPKMRVTAEVAHAFIGKRHANPTA